MDRYDALGNSVVLLTLSIATSILFAKFFIVTTSSSFLSIIAVNALFGSTALQIVGLENVVETIPKFFSLLRDLYALPLSISNFTARVPTELGPNRHNPV
jgi:hypothetical protein